MPQGRFLASDGAPGPVAPAAPMGRFTADGVDLQALVDVPRPREPLVGWQSAPLPVTLPGQPLEDGNVNLYRQPKVKNPDGSSSTVDSRSFEIDGREVLLPSVTPDGRHLATDNEVLDEYRRTGRHLGRFATPDDATTFAGKLHDDYAAGRYDVERETPTDAPTESRSVLDWLGDLKTGLVRGVFGAGQSVAGLGDLATGGRVTPTLKRLGIDLEGMRDIAGLQYSPQQRAANTDLADADGLGDVLSTVARNPSVISDTIAEAVPSMLGGAGLARMGAKAVPWLSRLGAGAIGEGTMAAGSTAEQTTRETGGLSPGQSALSVATGAATAGLGAAGGRLAQKLGLGDVETLLAGGGLPEPAQRSLARRVFLGALSEGLLEELPQSVQEQALLNLATGRPLDDGLDHAAVLGVLAGGVMGGAANLPASRSALPAAAPLEGPAEPHPAVPVDAPPLQAEPPGVPASVTPAGPVPPPSIIDLLATGEQQPRLPGDVGEVRNQDVKTPEIDMPFSLAVETNERPTGATMGLFAPTDGAPEPESVASTPSTHIPEGNEPPTAPPTEEPPAPAAPALPPQPKGRTLLNVPAVKVTYDETTDAERRELRRIHAELVEFPFEPRVMTPVERGKGQAYEFMSGSHGAPVYSDIVTTDRRGKEQGSRSDVGNAIEAFLKTGKRSALSDRATDVARRRLAGDRTLARPMLPEEYGDLPGGLTLKATEGLSPEQQPVEKRFRQAVERDAKGFMDRYRERFGNVIGADNVAELSDEYAATPESRSQHTRSVYGTASRLARAIYRQRVRESTDEGKQSIVVFTAGGTGSGKTSSLDHVPELRDAAHLVYDSTLSNFDGAVEDIEAALTADHEVGIVFTVRDVEQAFRSGVLPRAAREGRVTPIGAHARSHVRSPQVFERLRQKYAGDDRVSFLVMDNTGQASDTRSFGEVDAPGRLHYDESHVRSNLQRIVDEERAAGRVPEHVYAHTAAAREGVAPQAGRAGAGPHETPRATVPAKVKRPKTEDRSRKAAPKADPLPDDHVGPVKVRTGLTRALPPAPAGKAPVPVTPRIRPSDIARQFTEMMGTVPVSTGHFRQRAFGIYKPDEQAIRLKVANNLQTLFHEGGHHFDMSVLGIDRTDARWKAELLDLGKATSAPSYSTKEKLQEGAAEFLQWWMLDPAEIRRRAPHYLAEFERQMATRPEWERAMRQIRTHVEGLLSQAPATRGKLRINRDRDPRFPRLMAAAADPKDAVRQFARLAVDDLQPIRTAVETMAATMGQAIDTRLHAYALARIARGSSGKAEAFLEYGVRGRNGQFVGPALAEVLSPVRNRIEVLGNYLVALRAIELHGRGIEPGMARSEAEGIAKETEAREDIRELEKAVEGVYAYQDALLEYARLFGSMSRDQIAAIKKVNQAYVPMQRVLDATEASIRGVAKRVANRELPIMKIRGSGRDVIDPFESIVKNTFAIVDMVEKNRAMQALTRQAHESKGSARFLERIPTPQLPTRFNLAQVTKDVRAALREAGVGEVDEKAVRKGFEKATAGVKDPTVIEVAGEAMKAGIQSVNPVPSNLDEVLNALVTVWTPSAFAKDSEQIVTVLRNGEREFWQVHEPALYEALTVMGARVTTYVSRFLGSATGVLRAGATLTPGFILRNPVRDTVGAWFQSRYGFVPVYDTLRGAIALVRGDEDAKQFFTSGVAQATMAAQTRGDRQKAVSRMVRHGWAATALNPLDVLRAISAFSESSTRLGEFKLALDAGGRERGLYGRLMAANQARPQLREEALARATMAARDVTTDFSRAGSVAREFNELQAFFNASVQGWVRFTETIERDPFGSGLRAATVALFSAALWTLNADEDDYEEKEAWEKATYWHVPIGTDGDAVKWLRIPKPFQWSYAADITEAALDFMQKGDATRFREMKERLVGTNPRQIVAALMPTFVLPSLEAWANYSSFRDTHIVRPWDTDLDTDLQFNDWTSETAKLLGQVIPIAPAHLDHLIYGHTAGLGRGVVAGADRTLSALGVVPRKSLPASPVQQLPIVGNFLSDASFSGSAQSIQDIYDLAEAFDKADASIKADERAGRPDAAAARFARKQAELPWQQRDAVLEARKELKALSPEIRAVYAASPTLVSPEQKRVRLDAIRDEMVDISRRALGKSGVQRRQAQ